MGEPAADRLREGPGRMDGPQPASPSGRSRRRRCACRSWRRCHSRRRRPLFIGKRGQEWISRAGWLAQAGDPEDSRDRSGENEWAVMGPEERWKLPRRQARRADASAQGIPSRDKALRCGTYTSGVAITGEMGEARTLAVDSGRRQGREGDGGRRGERQPQPARSARANGCPADQLARAQAQPAVRVKCLG
jgi:hypothetical protein